MKVLVTGGTGVVGRAAVTALLKRGHRVRLLSRNAERDAHDWPFGVESHEGSVGNEREVLNAATGCDAVLHVAGIVAEQGDQTFENVNVAGTRLLIAEAERTGVKKFVYVSSLGADRGASGYHQSKRAAEALTRGFHGGWIVARPGNVYGPGDDVISLVLKMVRTVPAVPVMDDGQHPFQPVWHQDVGRALAVCLERDDLLGRTLDMAGPDRTTMSDLLARLSRITGKSPMQLPVPAMFAGIGVAIAKGLGVDLPVSADQITMLVEGNVIADDQPNALGDLLGITPTSLDDGLRMLADGLPEQLPGEGVGALERKRVYAEIEGSDVTPEALFSLFLANFAELTPWQVKTDAEPNTITRFVEGQTITMSLPGRGNIQVRVAEVTSARMTLMSVEGHPLAGAVRFIAEQRGERVRFEVQTFEHPANVVDWVAWKLFAGHAQEVTWVQTVNNVVKLSGGVAPDGAQVEAVTLDDEQARDVELWLRELQRQIRHREHRGEDLSAEL